MYIVMIHIPNHELRVINVGPETDAGFEFAYDPKEYGMLPEHKTKLDIFQSFHEASDWIVANHPELQP